MLTGLNEGDWVALYDGETDELQKVARIEHKFTLTGKEAKAYKKNVVDVLMIRHQDKSAKHMDESGNVSNEYLIIDAATSKELDHKHHNLIVRAVPTCRNVTICGQFSPTWNDLIEKQTLIYLLSDLDWKTLPSNDLKEVYNILMRQSMREKHAS